jgi:hypothetical protein
MSFGIPSTARQFPSLNQETAAFERTGVSPLTFEADRRFALSPWTYPGQIASVESGPSIRLQMNRTFATQGDGRSPNLTYSSAQTLASTICPDL